jgi:hypothetical protein
VFVSSNRHTLLLVDLDLSVQVDGGDDQVAGNVQSANNVQGVGIFERNSLGHLHHSKNDDNVGTVQHILGQLGCKHSESHMKVLEM